MKKAAAERLQEARELMLEKFLPTVLVELERLLTDYDAPPAVRMRAYADLLDRVGLGATQKTDAVVHTEQSGDGEVDRNITLLIEEMARSTPPAPAGQST